MTEIVLVWWLIIGGSANILIPVPYQDKVQCEQAATEMGVPKSMFLCVQQPVTDIQEWAKKRTDLKPYYGINPTEK